MTFDLKPDMLRCPDCRTGGVEVCNEPLPGFRCAACGRFMEQRGPVVDALPKTISGKAAVNLEHYEEMANSDNSLLDWRAKTRNHRIKFEAITGILGLNGDGPRKSVFEAGVGAGTHGAAIARLGHRYAGLDISAASLYRAAREHAVLADTALIAGDATAIPLADNLFDAVYCVATLHHLPEPLAGLRELIRVLRPGGVFCLMEPRWYYPTQIYGYLRHPNVEVGTFKVRSGRLLGALRACGVREARIKQCVFTPNRPVALEPVFNIIDRVCDTVPPLRFFSVVRCMHGIK